MSTFIRRGWHQMESGLSRFRGQPTVKIRRHFLKLIGRPRRITQIRFAVCAYALAGALATASGALAQADPVTFINQGGVQAIQVLGPRVPPAQRLARFRELFIADFDVAGMGQFALGQYWNSATPQQQEEFLRLFREYVVHTLSARSAAYAGETFRAISAQQNGGYTVVSSEVVQTDGTRSPLYWYLANRGGWKIVDVYILGVSVRQTARDEVASVMRQGGGQISYLLDRMREKVASGG